MKDKSKKSVNVKLGKVYLVGSGPGDLGLLTLKGLELLKKADVIIYDRLVSKAIIQEIPSKTKKLYVGKSTGKHSVPQEKINQLIIKESKQGKRVVRLKGGDPFIFGRGGEEAQSLFSASIPFEIVPGISSASAVPAYAGIPLTHRDYASSAAIVTGHEGWAKKGSQVNWEGLAKAVDTIVILMGVSSLESIIKGITKGGRHKDTPVAIIEDGTTRKQRVTIGKLSDIVKRAKKSKVKPPAVIVIGDVVKLRKELAWLRGSKRES
ncbi:MAG: uroporphyrinogen-III C-methyltransferase [Candidatus Bathyarchaeia archaeon]